jgi:glycine cleavage system aminomethyltransferase T
VVALDPDAIVLGGEPVLLDGAVVGHVTSAAFSPTVGRTVAYAKVAPGIDVGDRVSIEYFGRPLDFVVSEPVLVDPAGDRVKGLIGVNG